GGQERWQHAAAERSARRARRRAERLLQLRRGRRRAGGSGVSVRVLGIDCGVERTGYGVIESDGRAHRLLAAGGIRTSPGTPLEARLLRIAQGLREAIGQHAPSAAAVEEVFHAVNVKTALKLAHVRGIALLVAAEAGLQMGEYSPLEVKSSVVGYGRAEKS